MGAVCIVLCTTSPFPCRLKGGDLQLNSHVKLMCRNSNNLAS